MLSEVFYYSFKYVYLNQTLQVFFKNYSSLSNAANNNFSWWDIEILEI